MYFGCPLLPWHWDMLSDLLVAYDLFFGFDAFVGIYENAILCGSDHI